MTRRGLGHQWDDENPGADGRVGRKGHVRVGQFKLGSFVAWKEKETLICRDRRGLEEGKKVPQVCSIS